MSTSLHNLFIDYIKEGVRSATNPGVQLHAHPYSLRRSFRLAFLAYFRIIANPESPFGATPSGAKHDAKYYYVIARQVVPTSVLEPVPTVQVGSAGVRAVPEVPAFAPRVLMYLLRGRSPLFLRKIHPRRPLIARQAVPTSVPDPAPTAQEGSAGARAVPEVPAL